MLAGSDFVRTISAAGIGKPSSISCVSSAMPG
jgi:hypothetical protein